MRTFRCMAAREVHQILRQWFEARGFETCETHLSLVFLGLDKVYKFKRPLDLGFVDFRQREARKRACAAEVELNRRLAPGVYLGLVSFTFDTGGEPTLRTQVPFEELQTGEPGVQMQRLPDAVRADSLLREGALRAHDMAAIARLLADFHARARCDAHTSQFGERACIAENVEENFRQIAASAGQYVSKDELARIVTSQRAFLAQSEKLFEKRVRDKRIRDGHGDLRLEHLYRTPAQDYLAIDCIEFNERFRFADVCADLAFLAMDLRYEGRTDLAEHLVAHYAAASGDYGLYDLLDFYTSYRAVVRAKVRSILALDPEAPPEVRARAHAQVRRYYDVALACAEPRASSACLVAVAGGIASGKSSLAHTLSQERAWPVLSSDRIRKELIGIPPTETRRDPSFRGAYADEMTARVYAEVLSRAASILRSGRSVILDASFRDRVTRAHVCELARVHGVPFAFLECRCSRDTALSRLDERAKGPSISDGRREIYDAFMQSFEPLVEVAPDHHCILDTTQPLAQTLARAQAFLAKVTHS